MQDLDILNNSFLIIGGPNTKKSEVARNLAKYFDYKLINLDREKHAYFNDFTDFDYDKYLEIKEKDEIKALNYIHKYEMNHLKYILDNIKENVVIDFGNTYTLIDNKNILENIKLFKNIILLELDEIEKDRTSLFEKKLYNNKVNKMIATTIINIEHKKANDVMKEIINNKEYKDIL